MRANHTSELQSAAAVPDEIREANFNAAMEWAERLRQMGMDPMVMDSNGVGGYHVWVLLDREYPLADTFDQPNTFFVGRSGVRCQ